MHILARRTSCWKEISMQRGGGQSPIVREVGMDKVAPRLREKRWLAQAASAKGAAKLWESAARAIGDVAKLEYGYVKEARERDEACHRLRCLVPNLPEAECDGVCYDERSKSDWAVFLEQLGCLGVVGGRCKYDREELRNWAADARRLARACRARQTRAARQKLAAWLHEAMQAGAADGHRAVKGGAIQCAELRGGGGAPWDPRREMREKRGV